MRVLICHNRYRIPGGEDSVFDNEVRLLKEKGEQVYTYVRDNADLRPVDLLTEALFSKKTYRDVRKLIRENDIEIVHVHNERFLISPSVFAAALDEGVPVVQTLHNFRLLCINALLYRKDKICRECIKDGRLSFLPAMCHGCFRDSRLLTFLSVRISRNRLKKYLNNVYYIALTDFNRDLFTGTLIRPDRIFVKPNFSPSFTGEKKEETERKDFLFLGRLDPSKGIEDILEKWKSLPSSFRLNIAGNGEEDYERELKNRFPLENATFLGRVDPDKVPGLLRSSKAMVFASRWYEGFPMTIIESFAEGTPVIGLDLGNGGDILKSIYSRKDALLKSIDDIPDRILSFDRDMENGLYDYDPGRLLPYTPDENYRILKGIYGEIRKDSSLRSE